MEYSLSNDDLRLLKIKQWFEKFKHFFTTEKGEATVSWKGTEIKGKVTQWPEAE